MTPYEIFTENDDEVLRDTWMSSNPNTNDMWYDKISKSPDDKYFLENMNLATDGIQFGSDCLVLRKYSELNPKFVLAVEACNQKQPCSSKLSLCAY